MTNPTDLRARAEALLKIADGFAGRFLWQKAHNFDRGCGDCADVCRVGDALVYVGTDVAFDDEQLNRDDVTTISEEVDEEVGAPMASILNDAPGIIRDMLAALPPDPTPPGERRPCEGWREGVSASELFVGTFLRLRAGAIAWEVEVVKTSGLARWCDTLKSGIVTGGPDAAKLAAEDAADALLLAGRRALGRV